MPDVGAEARAVVEESFSWSISKHCKVETKFQCTCKAQSTHKQVAYRLVYPAAILTGLHHADTMMIQCCPLAGLEDAGGEYMDRVSHSKSSYEKFSVRQMARTQAVG